MSEIHNPAAQLPGFRNLLVNSKFLINQRTYVSGTALGTSAYGHDRWRDSGAGGTAYTFAAPPVGENHASYTTIRGVTITAGSLMQVIEGQNIQSSTGNFTLSWIGSAAGLIVYSNGTSNVTVASGASPLTGPVPNGCTVYISFFTGTLSQPQFEASPYPTAFENRPACIELELCQRYYQLVYPSIRQGNGAAGIPYDCSVYFNPMRATPTATLVSAGTRNNISSVTLIPFQANSGRFEMTASATADTYALNDVWSLSAEL